jgi:hypothetical protein
MNKQAYNITIFFKPATRTPAKFRNVTNLKKCVEYCNSKLGIVYYVNLYDPVTKIFIRREWIKDFKK